MSVVSSVASDVDMLALAQNERFRKDAVEIAGKFEVLRIEIVSTTMSPRNIIVLNIEQDLKHWGIASHFRIAALALHCLRFNPASRPRLQGCVSSARYD